MFAASVSPGADPAEPSSAEPDQLRSRTCREPLGTLQKWRKPKPRGWSLFQRQETDRTSTGSGSGSTEELNPPSVPDGAGSGAPEWPGRCYGSSIGTRVRSLPAIDQVTINQETSEQLVPKIERDSSWPGSAGRAGLAPLPRGLRQDPEGGALRQARGRSRGGRAPTNPNPNPDL